jgi:hypothetical protein
MRLSTAWVPRSGYNAHQRRARQGKTCTERSEVERVSRFGGGIGAVVASVQRQHGEYGMTMQPPNQNPPSPVRKVVLESTTSSWSLSGKLCMKSKTDHWTCQAHIGRLAG